MPAMPPAPAVQVAPPAPEPASSAIPSFNAAVRNAYARVRADQAKSAPANDRERLERLADLDQAGREALAQLDLAHMSESDRRAAEPGFRKIGMQDLADQAQLKAMMPPAGWFTRRKYGRKAALGAWLVVDHAVNDPALMRQVLARLKPLALSGGFEGRQYAIMYDRVALTFDHRPQRYGTQITCQAGAWRALNVEAPAAELDRRRRAVGFKETEAEYLKGSSGACR